MISSYGIYCKYFTFSDFYIIISAEMNDATDNSLLLRRTIFYDKESETLCSCSGNFYKTCALRLANNLPCEESFVHISPIKRENETDPTDDVLKALNELNKKITGFNKLKFIPKR